MAITDIIGYDNYGLPILRSPQSKMVNGMPAVRNAPLYVAPPPPPPVPMASEVRPAAPIAPTFQPMVVERLPMLTSVPQRAVAPATDYSRPEFQLPNIPERPTLPQMPTRDFGQEQRVTSRNTLRATLLGALLGGGAGALGAMTGAQQGARQAFDQDYAQRMAQFQNEQQMALQQNQFANQEYNQRIAAVNALVGRADAQRAANQQFLDTDYSNQVAQYNAQIAANELARKTADEREQRVRDLMGNIPKVSKEDQARFIQFGLTGDPSFAAGGFTPYEAPKQVPPPSFSQAATAVDRFLKTWPTRYNDPQSYAAAASSLKSTLRMSSDPMVAGLADTIPNAMPRDFVSKLRADIAANKLAATTADNDEDRKLARQRIAIQQSHLDLAVKAGNLAERREQRLRAGKASVSSYAKDAKAIVNGFVKAINEVQGQIATGEVTKGEGAKLIADLDARMMEAYNRDKDLFASSPKGKSGYIPVLLSGDSATPSKPAAPAGGAAGLDAFNPRKVK